jgi:hypothetical protein
MDLTIILSTDMQNWHDYDVCQLPNSTAQCEVKVVSADSSCSVVWWGLRAACPEVSTGSIEASKAKHGPGLHNMEPRIYR